jgi:LPS export ABC transporter protein LptC
MPGFAARHRSSPRVSGRAAALLAAGFLAAGFLAAGCSLDYQLADDAKTAEGIPDTVAIGLVHKVHRGGRLSLQLEASRAETYNATNTTILSQAHFVEYDGEGATATEGKADKVVFHSDTENAEISGSVRVRSSSESGDVSAQSLAWLNKEKKLTAPADDKVTISRDDGTFITGRGFVGDFRSRQVTFSGPVEGRYVWKGN